MTQTLTAGTRYIGTIVGIFEGKLVYSEVGFTAAINHTPIPYNDDSMAAERVTVYVVKHPRHPKLISKRHYVAGSIRKA